jgi:hypothetical protein
MTTIFGDWDIIVCLAGHGSRFNSSSHALRILERNTVLATHSARGGEGKSSPCASTQCTVFGAGAL